ncbi:MAG: DUF2177 family protein [Bacteroidia bacterium]|nr:DUF2177 family protein [Bacteroidia bacterium]
MKLLLPFGVLFAMYIAIIILDYIWLGILTKKFIIDQFGSLISVKDGSIQTNIPVGLLAWLAIAAGAYIFAVAPAGSAGRAAFMGAVFGFIAYAIYDLTNLTFITNYPTKFVLVDIAWGTFLCSAIAYIGFFTRSLFLK